MSDLYCLASYHKHNGLIMEYVMHYTKVVRYTGVSNVIRSGKVSMLKV